MNRTSSYIAVLRAFLVLCTSCFVLVLTSCDSYLDVLPDNRTEINTEEKVQKILTSAYFTNDPLFVAEFSSDNVDDYGPSNPNTNRFVDQVYHWQDVTESDNESPEFFWEDAYTCIATANLALKSIAEMGGPTTTALSEMKGEALLCRAYAHFMLVNMFSLQYNKESSTTDLGIPYVTEMETTIGTTYERGTVAEVYEKIEKDLLEALPLIGDTHYTTYGGVAKYHFTLRAAHAFACRFYLYTEQWEKAARYATLCLGSQPAGMLRDWQYVSTMTQSSSAVCQHYIDASLNCNLLLLTGYSYMGLVFGPYRYLSKYSHGKYLAQTEDGEAMNIWGSASFYHPMSTYSATNLDKTIFWKLPYLFEYYDAVAGTGWFRTVYPAFTCDETLLNRAEAYVMMGQYNQAAQDLTTWMQNIVSTTLVLTPEAIQEFYNSVDYSYSDARGIESTIKKHLHPKFDIGAEGEMREAMLQCVLGFRRIETLQTGQRWYDVKRYGLEIVRRVINADGVPESLTDVLRVDDPRRAIQIPLKVRTAGLEPNPR